MIRFFILLFLFCLQIILVEGQKFIPYKDTVNGLWGIKNTLLNKPVTRGKWLELNSTDFNDSIFHVADISKISQFVDTNGRILFKSCCYSAIYLNRTNIFNTNYPYDKVNEKRLVEDPFWNSRGEKVNSSPFFIDYKQQCYPADYYPCPAWRKVRDGGLPKHLELLQKGEEKRWNKEIDSAVYYCKLAITLDSLNPSIYYWGASLFIDNFQEKIFIRNNKKYQSYYPWIKYCLDKADELENKNPYKTFIIEKRYKFYKKNLKEKKTAKRIKQSRIGISK